MYNTHKFSSVFPSDSFAGLVQKPDPKRNRNIKDRKKYLGISMITFCYMLFDLSSASSDTPLIYFSKKY